MLDTTALTLDAHEFEVLDPGRFSPSAEGLLKPPYYRLGARGNFACYQNPTRADFDAGRYLPRLTLARRRVRGGFALTLRIEFSAPKLVFGNNFDELTSRDFEQALAALHRALTSMAVRVSERTLRAARVSAIHYSKNVAFTDFTTCSMVMQELDRIDLDARLDLSHTDYRNQGHAIRYHANSFEVTFYDKLRDLEKARISEKRALERDNRIQADLFLDRGRFPKQLEVLRMEVRLGNRTKIKAVLKRIGDEREPTFAALFDASLAQDVLLHFWQGIRRQLPLAGLTERRPEELLSVIAAACDGRGRPGALLQQLGYLLLIESVGVRGASALLSRHCSPRTWQRYKRELRDLNMPDSAGFQALRHVGEALDRFQPLRLANFQCETAAGSISVDSR